MTTRESAMPRDMVDEFRRRLQAQREALIRTVAATDDELATLEAHPAGALSEDVGTELAAGTFGTCERCARPIPLARLRAKPTARHCVPCQSREEG